jgi:hypothetical protein
LSIEPVNQFKFPVSVERREYSFGCRNIESVDQSDCTASVERWKHCFSLQSTGR